MQWQLDNLHLCVFSHTRELNGQPNGRLNIDVLCRYDPWVPTTFFTKKTTKQNKNSEIVTLGGGKGILIFHWKKKQKKKHLKNRGSVVKAQVSQAASQRFKHGLGWFFFSFSFPFPLFPPSFSLSLLPFPSSSSPPPPPSCYFSNSDTAQMFKKIYLKICMKTHTCTHKFSLLLTELGTWIDKLFADDNSSWFVIHWINILFIEFICYMSITGLSRRKHTCIQSNM